MPAISDKLKSLGVKIGTAQIPPAAHKNTPKKHTKLEDALEGRWVNTPRGDAFVVEQIFGADYHHGKAAILPTSSLANMALWAGDERIQQLELSQLAFLDTETTGLSGGTGTYVFMVGIGKFIDQNFHLSIFFLEDPRNEPAMLEAISAFITPSAALVTFNGKAFDAPLLRTRYTLNNMPCPFDGFSHIDLLPLARRLWRDRLPSRALKYLEEHIMSAPRTSEEVPGYEIPFLYFDFLRDGNPMPLKGVFYHNAMDVVAMAGLLTITAEMLADPLGIELEHGQDIIALAKLFEDLNRWDNAAILYERGLKNPLLPEPDFWQAVRRLSALQRRRGDMETALRLWEQAATEGHIYAHIELAKYYEHTLRDPESALGWTSSAIQHAEVADLPGYIRKHWLEELNHRLNRLQTKIRKP